MDTDEKVPFMVTGYVKIRDKKTNEILFDGQNAVHFGNIAASMVKALAGDETGQVRYMAFGNGGTRIASDGEIIYKEPNVSIIRNNTDSLYNETFHKEIDQSLQNKISVILGSTNFSDLKTTVTLTFDESNLNQGIIDRGTSLADGSKGASVFDELALYTGAPGITGLLSESSATMITHLVFHPIEKSTNRELEIEYTLRIEMG